MPDTSTISSRIAAYLTTIAFICCLYGAWVWTGRPGEPDQLHWFAFYGVASATVLGCRAYLAGVDLRARARSTLVAGRRGIDAAPEARGVATVAVAVLVVSATFVGGLALVGTQPVTENQSGTASAVAGDLVWNSSTGGSVMSDPTIVNGTVYVGSKDNSIYAFDADTGNKKWSFSTGGEIHGAPTVWNGTVYVGSWDNSIYALDANTGTKEWSYATGSYIDSSVTVSNGTVYAGSRDNSIYALDANTGTKEWSYATGGAVASSPTVKNNTVYVGSNDNSLYALNAETGTEEWSSATGNSIGTAPTVANGSVFVGSMDGSVYAFDAGTGQQKWSFATGDDVYDSSPTVKNGTVYIGSYDHYLYALDVDTGSQKWRYLTGGTIYSSPTIANGTVYVGSHDNRVYAVDAQSGAAEWQFTTAGSVRSSPTVAGGTVYIGSHDNGLYALDTSHSKDSSGSRNELHTLGHVGAVEQTDQTAPTGTDLNGTVENQNGQPVANATVTVTGVDRANLDVSPSELESRAKEILDDATNAKPPDWNPDRQLTGNGGIFGEAATEYVAAHPKGDWGLTAFADNPSLENPRVQLPAGEEIALSVWDPTAGGIVQDGVNSDLTGAVVDDTNIVIKSIDHAGGVVDTQTVETDTTYEVGGPLGGSHDLATTTLPAGFYRVHPGGSPETAYVIVVGNPDQIVESIRADLRNEAGQLTKQAQQARDYLNQNVLRQYTTTTDANGSWSVDVPDSVTRVSVQAHKAPPGLSQDPRNASLQDIREFYAITDYNGSYVMPASAGTYSVPANDITVRVVETEAPQFADLGRYRNATEAFRSLLQNLSYSDLPSTLQQRLDELSRANLEDTAEKLQKLTNQNSQLEARVEELLNRDLSEIAVNSSSSAELREQIQAQQQAISELRSTIEASETTSEVAEGVASSAATFAEELTQEQIRVVANFPNGTSREVPSEYISLDQSVATLIGQGGTQVAVEDYPLGNAESVTFDYVVVTESGVGSTTTRAGTTSIGLDAISLSTLRPGPDEQVDVTLVGDDDTQVTNITNVRAVAPDGSELTTSTDGPNTARFTTSGQGRHYVEVTFQTASGSTGTLTHRIKAGPNDQAMPPGVRIKQTPFGTLAVVGDGFEAGSVATEQGGTVIDVTAQIGPNADAPATMHVYAHGMDVPPQATMSISVVRGESQQNIQRNVEVTAHLPAMTSENAVLYRNSEAMPRDGEGRIADVSTSADGTTITTVTDANGRVSIETNNNPGFIERAQWWIDRNAPDLPNVPFVGQLPAPTLLGQLPVVPQPDVIGALVWTPPTAPAAETAPTIDAGPTAAAI